MKGETEITIQHQIAKVCQRKFPKIYVNNIREMVKEVSAMITKCSLKITISNVLEDCISKGFRRVFIQKSINS